MEIFSTSKDLINLALTIGIIGISAAMVYFLISAAGLIKEMRQTIDEFNRQLEIIGQITQSIKNKVTYLFSYWSILEKLTHKAVDLVQTSLAGRFKKKFNQAAEHFTKAAEEFSAESPVQKTGRAKTKKSSNKK